MTNGQPTVASVQEKKLSLTHGSWRFALLLLVVTLVAYQPVLRHAGFIWDDDRYVNANPALRSVDGLKGIWIKPGTTIQYYPLVFTSFWVEYHLWGLQPFGYHLVNILLHTLNALLLWRVLQRLEISGAWLAALIFAIHPVQVESVAWITERKNVLSCLFYLLAALAYLRFRPLTDAKPARPWDWRVYPLVIALFLAALLSKTVTCSLPAALLLLVWWKTGRVEKRDALPLAPLFILGAVLGVATAWMEKHAVGATGAEWTLSFVQRCLVAGRALWFYAGKLFWPQQLTFNYPRWEIDAGAAWQYLFPVAALAVLIALGWLRSRIGRGPLVAVLCFAGTLVPALGFFDVYPFRYSYVADHFQYLACIGLIALTASAGAALYQRAGQQGRGLGKLATALVLVLLGVSTWKQAHIYQDQETLWRDTLTKNPAAWMAHNNLSVILIQQGKIEEAIWHSEQALRLKPDDAAARNNLGNALLQAGRVNEAIGQYEQALQLIPNFPEAHFDLGIALERTGRLPDAIAHFEQALRLNPDYPEAHGNLGNALLQAGHVNDALAHLQQALRLMPDSALAHYNLGNALLQAGQIKESMEQYEQALQLNPDYGEAHNNLGNAFLQAGQVNDALAHFQQAVRLKPDSALVHYNLGNALKQTGNVREAAQHYQEALRLDPDYAAARSALARLQPHP